MAGGNDIDSLKFNIVLDSKKFEDEMKRVEGIAKKFEDAVSKSLTITNLLEMAQSKGAKEKVRSQKEVVLLTRQELEAKKAAGEITVGELKQLKQIVAADKAILDEENKQLAAQKKQLDIENKKLLLKKRQKVATDEEGAAITLNSTKLVQQTAIMKGLSSYIMQYASVFGAATVMRNLVRITGEFEAQRTALRAILQDTAAADNIFNQLQVLAVKSPFTFQNLTSYAKQLTAFSVPVNEVYETTKKLADVSAGLGVDMGRIILAYGQVRSAEFLRGQEVRQFTEAGIPILKELADQFKEIEGHAISVGEVFNRISARQVPFAMVEEAFNRMTSAGGKFYNMQEVLAETVKGKVSNLQDAWEIMLSKIGDEHSGQIKDIITSITNLLSHYKTWMTLLEGVIKYVGIYNGLLLILNTYTKAANAVSMLWNGAMIIHNQQVKLSTILLPTNIALEKISIKNKKDEAAAIAAINAARKTALGVLALISAALWTYGQHIKRVREEENRTTDIINTSMAKLSMTMADFEIGANRVEDSFKKMKEKEGDATKETEAFHNAVDELKKQFPKFIDDNVKLAETIDDLAQYWAHAREEMNRYYADESRETIRTDLKAQRDEDVQSLEKSFTKYITRPFKDASLGKQQSIFAWRYVTGALNREEISSALDEINKAWQKHNHDNRDYTQDILRNLDDYVNQYQAIMKRYTDGIILAEEQIKAASLSTTRQSINEQLFPLTGMGMWNLTGGGQISYSDMTIEQQEQALRIWAENNDFAFHAEDSISSWAERQREKLDAGTLSEKVAGVIKNIFEQLNEPVSKKLAEGTWQKDVENMANNFGEVIREALEEMGTMSEEEIDVFVQENKGKAQMFKAKATDLLSDFIAARVKDLDDAIKGIKAQPEAYANFSDIGFTSDWLTRLFLQHVSEQWYGEGNVDFSGSTKDSKEKEREAERQRKERQRQYQEYKRNQIADIKQRVQDLKELKSAYDQFKSLGFGDSQIGDILTGFFGKGIPEGGFGAAFESLAQKMDKYSPNDAQDIRNLAAGKDWKEYAKKVEDAQKATQKFAESLEDLQASTKRLNLEGFAAELDKILVDTDSKNRKLRTDWDQKERELEEAKDGWIAQYRVENEKATAEDAEKAWKTFFERQKTMAKKSIDTQIEYNNKTAQIAIDKKADEWVKTLLEREDIDMSDWADKTPAQIDLIKEKLESLRANLGELIPPELQDDADDVKVTFDTLLKLIEEILQKKIDTTDLEKAKKELSELEKSLKSIGNYLSKFGSAVSKFGEIGGIDYGAIGNGLSTVGDSLSSFADIYKKMQSGEMSKGAGMASGFMAATEIILDNTARTIQNFKQMKEATEAWNLELKQSVYELENLQLDRLGYEQKNVFGVESPYSKALAASKQLKEAQQRLFALTNDIADIQVKTGEKKVQDWGKSAESFLEYTAAGAMIGGTVGGPWGALIGAIAGSITGLVKAAFADKKMVDVFQSLGELTGGMIFDPKTLELHDEVLARYNQMDEAGKAIVDHWKEIKDVMKEALDTFNDNVEDVVGDIGQSIKDMLVDAFNNGDVYDAIDDIHDYIGNTIQDLMMDIAFSKALQPLFDELEKDMRHSFGIDENGNLLEKFDSEVDYDWVDDLLKFNEGLEYALPLWEKAMGEAQVGLQSLGYNWNTGDNNDSGSLGSGIKSITEDTANLLASYINAIRADVSYIRVMEEKGWGQIAVIGESVPTLAEYMSQVAANTFDTAQNTQRILSEMQSVIGPPGTSGMVVRVESY